MNNVSIAKPLQAIQDWLTQQWVIISGRRIEPDSESWLMGSFGKPGGIADEFVAQLAEEEGLVIQRNQTTYGLIPSFKKLNLPEARLEHLAKEVIDFYENTPKYELELIVKWNPFFRIWGKLVNALFSRRIKQLHIPTTSLDSSSGLTSEIIALTEPLSGKPKYIIWYRTLESGKKVLYSGVYSLCSLPSGKVCVKAVFPLPNGNATVILSPNIGEEGEFILESSGKRFGDAGFYFLLQDSRGKNWATYIKSFRDKLSVYSIDGQIFAEQVLTLGHLRVVSFTYTIQKKHNALQEP